MRSWAEGLMALLIVAALGWGLSLYTGPAEPSGGPSTPPTGVDPEAASRGAILADSAGCLLCHTVDGSSSTAPTFKGLAGSNRPLTTGEFVIADDTYLFNSIINPSLQVVSGYDDLMPKTFRETLTDEEIQDLIAYINSLGS